MRNLLLLIAAFISMGASSCNSIPIDKAISASEGNEASILLCGLGDCNKGYLFAQVNEGVIPNGIIELRMPSVLNCDRPACVKFQIWLPDGSQGYSGAIPKNKDRASFTVADVTQPGIQEPSPINKSHDGEYLIKVKAWFKDNYKQERTMMGWGFIRLNILNQNYEQISCNDPVTAWSFTIRDSCTGHMTTGFRTALCGSGC